MDGSLNDEVRREVKRHYIGGIVAAVLMVALGAVMLFWPVESLAAILWIIAIVFLVVGVYRVVAYIRMPYFLQQSFSLAIGILDIICSIVMLVSMASDPLMTSSVFAWFIGFMFGFYALFAGVNLLAGSGFVRRLGGSSGWLVASGILELIAGILLLSVPLSGGVFLMYLLALAFIVGGASLIATAVDLKNRIHSFERAAEELEAEHVNLNDPFFMWRR